MSLWAIDEVNIKGGFLGDLSLRFPSGLICVIGPRGSGKSTLAEAIRVALFGVPKDASKQRMDLLKANLGSSVFSLSTRSGTMRGGFTIRRTFGQTAILTGEDARSVTSIDLDQGTFLPLDAYTSLDVEAIADESLGSKRRALLDELCLAEMREIESELSNHRRLLDANAERIKQTEQELSELTEQIEEFGDTKAKLEALPEIGKKEGSPEFQSISKQKQFNDKEGDSLRTTLEQLRELNDVIPQIVARTKKEIPTPLVVGESANNHILGNVDNVLQQLWRSADQSIANIVGTITNAEKEIAKHFALLNDAHAEQAAMYLALEHENQEIVGRLEARASAEQQATTQRKLQQRQIERIQVLKDKWDERKRLKGAYVIARDRVSSLREAVAKRLEEKAGSKVRIRLQRNADSNNYEQQISASLYGSKLKNQDEIINVISAIRPDDLAFMLREKDFAEFETHTSFGKERGRKIFEALSGKFDPMELDVLPIEDRVTIELNVSSGSTPKFKDASELSRGQKCTALLPILMARRDTPLLIDQPEDNLDNHFIYETVVETILRIKAHRQMIFITHNANIPVLGEADLVVVMNSDGTHGFVEKSGTIDECRNEIIDLLEGGEEAFAMRRKRYES